MVQASIIIPNLNSPILGDVLNSLMKQEGIENCEILVVGMDKYNFQARFPTVQFYTTAEPTAPAIARNIGILNSSGDIIIFLDADCIVSSKWLRKLLIHFNNPDENVVGGGVAFPNDNFLTVCDNVASFHEYLHSLPKGQKDQLPSLNLAVRRKVINKVGLFNESYPYAAGEDAEFTTRIRLKGLTLNFDPEAFVYHKPQRKSIRDLLNHAYRLGQFSIKINPHYKQTLNSIIFSNWLLVILLSPILALGIIIKIAFLEKLKPRYWLTLPVVFILKLFWCFGAASTLNKRRGIF